MNLRQLRAAHNGAGKRLNKAAALRDDLDKQLREAEVELAKASAEYDQTWRNLDAFKRLASVVRKKKRKVFIETDP